MPKEKRRSEDEVPDIEEEEYAIVENRCIQYKTYLMKARAYPILQEILKTLFKERPDDPIRFIEDVFSDQSWVNLRHERDRLEAKVMSLTQENATMRMKLTSEVLQEAVSRVEDNEDM